MGWLGDWKIAEGRGVWGLKSERIPYGGAGGVGGGAIKPFTFLYSKVWTEDNIPYCTQVHLRQWGLERALSGRDEQSKL